MRASETNPPAPPTRRTIARSIALTVASIAVYAVAAGAQQSTGTTPTAGSVLIRNVRLFDGERVVQTTSVLVTNGRITRVGSSITAPAGTPVIDGTGKTLVPGFIDSHTHSWGTALRDAAVFGVTTALDMFTEPNSAAEFRRLDGTAAGRETADFRSAGVLATAPKGHGTQFGVPIPTITSPKDAQSFVDARLAEGSDYIKIVYDDGRAYSLTVATIDKQTLKALIDATHARRKLAVVHIGDQGSARDAIEAGADGLVHLFADRAPDADFAKLVAGRKAFVIPTLTVIESVAWGKGGEELAKDARLAPYIRAENLDGLKRTFPPRAGSTRTFAGQSRRCVSSTPPAFRSSPEATHPTRAPRTGQAFTASSSCSCRPA